MISFSKYHQQFITLLLLVCASGLQASASANIEIGISLKESVNVYKNNFTLGDVAVLKVCEQAGKCIENSGRDLIVELNSIVIGKAPKPGVPVFITKSNVAAKVKKSNVISLGRITWNEINIVKVNSYGEVLNKDKIINSAYVFFDNFLSERYANYDIQQSGLLKDLVIKSGEVNIAPYIDKKRTLKNRNCIWVDIFVNNELQSTQQVWFKTKVYAEAVVLQKDYSKHDRLQKASLKKIMMNVAGIEGELFNYEEITPSYRFTKGMKINDIVTYNNVEAVPLVEKGSIVSVTAHVGTVIIRNKAIALSDGEMFEKIMVHNRTNNNAYAVVITGNQEVTINVN